MTTTDPHALHITIELARAVRTGDEYFYRFVPMQYLLRQQGGRYQSADFNWTAELQEQIAALQNARPDPALAQRIGRLLYEFLIAAGFAELEDSIIQAVRAHRPVYLTLCFAAAELFTLPWELVTLRSGERLAAIPEVLIRYEWPDTVTRPLPTENALDTGRVLFAWSGAGGAVPAGEHLSAIAQACRRGNVDFDSTRDQVRNLSAASLLQALQQPGKPVAVLHLLCHGGVVESGSTVYGLVWNSTDGDEPHVVDPEALGRLLSPFAATLRLVVVSACLGGNLGDVGSRLGSVAQALHRVGIEAVIASRMPLSVKGSIELSETFYNALLVTPQPLEEALRQARLRLAQDPVSLDWASIQLHARAAAGDDTRPLAFRPYRGLFPFHQQNRRFFFGREQETAELEHRIQDAVTGSKPALQLLLGDAGTGKTSLVQAGLLPRLRELAGGNCELVPVAPGAEPLFALWKGLQGVSAEVGEPPAQIDVAALRAAAQRLFVARPGRFFLIVVDALDEAIGPEVPDDARSRFLEALWELSRTPDKDCVVLALLDGVAPPLPIAPGGPTLAAIAADPEHCMRIEPLAGEPLERAIVAPLQLVGMDFERGLVDRILADLRGSNCALPLLSHSLDLLWQRRHGGRLTATAYKQIGGITGSIASGADRVFTSLASDEERAVARAALLEMVVLGGDDESLSRRRVRREDIRPRDETRARLFDSAIGRLIAERLILSRGEQGGAGKMGATWLELAHEALLREWPTLRGWIQEQGAELRACRELRDRAHSWLQHQSDGDGGSSHLLRGAALAGARTRWAAQADFIGPLASAFLDASIRAEQLHADIARRQRRQRVATTLVAVLTVIGLSLALWFLKTSYHQNSLLIRIQKLLDRKDGPHGATTAALLLLEARTPRDPVRLTRLGLRALGAPIEKLRLQLPVGPDGQLHAIAVAQVDPLGRRLAAGSDQGEFVLWSVESGQAVPRLAEHSVGSHISSIGFNPDGSVVLVAWRDAILRLFRAGSGALLSEHHSRSQIRLAHWSPDGTRILLGCQDGTARVLSTDLANERKIYAGPSPLYTAAWSPDGTFVAAGAEDGSAVLISAASGGSRPLEPHTDITHIVAWSPDGQWILTGSFDYTAHISPVSGGPAEPVPVRGMMSSSTWSPDSESFVISYYTRDDVIYSRDGPASIASLSEESCATTAVAWNRDGDRIATGANDGTIRLFGPSGHQLFLPAVGHDGAVRYVQFSADSRRLFSASADGTARVWELPERLEGYRGPRALESCALSHDGAYIAAAGGDGDVHVWCTCPQLPEQPPRKVHTDIVHSVAFLRDSRHIVTASADKKAAIIPIDPTQPIVYLIGHESVVSSALPSPDGTEIATASNDGSVRVWDRAGRHLLAFCHEGSVKSIAWSPDGKRLASSSRDGTAWVWPVHTDAPALRVSEPTGFQIYSVAWSPTGDYLALASGAGVVSVRDTLDASLLWETIASHSGLLLVSWSPDGDSIAATGIDRNVYLLDAASGVVTDLKHRLDGLVWSFAWSPAGQRLAAGSDDRTVAMFAKRGGWTLVEQPMLPPLDDAVSKVAFDAQGEKLLIGTYDGRVRLVPVPAEDQTLPSLAEIRSSIRSRTALCLTVKEREEFLDESPAQARTKFLACEAGSRRLP